MRDHQDGDMQTPEYIALIQFLAVGIIALMSIRLSNETQA
jgi:hypothetical protein